MAAVANLLVALGKESPESAPLIGYFGARTDYRSRGPPIQNPDVFVTWRILRKSGSNLLIIEILLPFQP